MTKLNIKITKLNDRAILPEYQTLHSAGMDICACIDTSMTIQPGERVVVQTGIAIELPVGYEAQIRARSGLSLKNGIVMANGVGTIDADYRGEVGVLIMNVGSEPFVVEHGMRIAQMVVAACEHVIWQQSPSLAQSDRGEGGYGSTGITQQIDN
jgi:dUTP pyrophosphatase